MFFVVGSDVGVPGPHQGLVPGQGFSLDKEVLHQQMLKQVTSNLLFFYILGFGGRGVLPGVATGTGLNPKSGKIFPD